MTVRHFPEAAVVHSLKLRLLRHGLDGAQVSRVIVDADPSYFHSRFARSLEPMATVRIAGSRPDLVCLAETSSFPLVLAFEVKARFLEWPKGLAQARRYRSGAHQSYLALPGPARELEKQAGSMARDSGVGLLALIREEWIHVLPAADPLPFPATLAATARILAGVPAARRLQLNHPLNYLVVPYLASTYPSVSLTEALERWWPDLGSSATRQHAIQGAVTLGLVDGNGTPTVDGYAVTDLMQSVRFDLGESVDKRKRLADVAPPLAAICRVVLLRQPAVRLLIEVLTEVQNNELSAGALYSAARRRDDTLADALFLVDPSRAPANDLSEVPFNPSTVFKMKQVLWHAGILSTKAHTTAGGRGGDYRSSEDVWVLDQRVYRSGTPP
jgi:hypothetical protein